MRIMSGIKSRVFTGTNATTLILEVAEFIKIVNASSDLTLLLTSIGTLEIPVIAKDPIEWTITVSYGKPDPVFDAQDYERYARRGVLT